jgi:hypothetical protein
MRGNKLTDCPSEILKGEEAGYTIQWPKKILYFNWLLVAMAAIFTIGIFLGDLGGFMLLLGVILLVIVLISAFVDFFITIPTAVGRSLRLPANLEWIGKQPIVRSKTAVFSSVLRHSADSVTTWILLLGGVCVLFPLDLTKGGESGLTLIPIVGPFVIWFFLIESGIMASLIGKAFYSSIPVMLFWTGAVFTTAILTGLRFGEYLVIAPIAAHVDTKYVPNYWQDDIEGIPEMQVKIFCVSMLIAWIITMVVSTVLLKRLVIKNFHSLPLDENAAPSA